MATIVELGIEAALIATIGCLAYNVWSKGKKENKNEQTPAQKEMQGITMKPQVQIDTFTRQPRAAGIFA